MTRLHESELPPIEPSAPDLQLGLRAAIRDQLIELLGYAPEAEYGMSAGFISDVDVTGFEEVGILTFRGGKENDALRLSLPYCDDNGLGRRVVASLNQSDEGWRSSFRGPVSLWDLARLTPSDAPPAVAASLELIHTTNFMGDPDTELSEQEAKRAETLLQDVEALLVKANVSTSYRFAYGAEINGDQVLVKASGLLPRPDGTFHEDWQTCTNIRLRFPGRCDYLLNVDGEGNARDKAFPPESFSDLSLVVPDDRLPSLTKDQRRLNPYDVTYLPRSLRPAELAKWSARYKVAVSSNLGTLGRPSEYVATKRRARRLAGLLLRRDLAKPPALLDVGPDELERISVALDVVLADAQTASLSTDAA